MKGYRVLTAHKGFTIVELLVVIVVIGILAAVTIVAYNGVAARANDATASQDIDGVVKQLETSKIQNGDTYPAPPPAAKVSYGSTLQYAQLGSGTGYCATISRANISYFVTNDFTNKMVGSCPDQTTISSGKYTLSDPDWTAAQIPTALNGTVATSLAGEAMSISTSLSAGSNTGTHIDANAGVASTRYCYPVVDLDGVPCPATPSPDMQLTSGLTMTITANLVPGAYNSLSFLMSDVEKNVATVTAYDANNSILSTSAWQVMSYGRAYDSYNGYYKSFEPSLAPNPYVNNGTNIAFGTVPSQNDDAMRVSFDLSTLASLKKVVVTFTSSSTTDWVQWNFLGRHN